MLRLASGVMWVEKEIMGLPEELLIVEPSPKKGLRLLSVILDGGNFGHHSSFQRLKDSYFYFRFAKTVHLMKIATLFPGEATFRFIHKIELLVKYILGRI